ncbi:MAG: CoA-binding protein [Bacteroidetes bacterium]|nr:MAG: CoA-binding protein [Bacteroidota bacterium]
MKPTLILGASPQPDRYAFLAAEMLKSYGHEVFAFGRRKGETGAGLPILINQSEVPDNQIDTITLYMNAEVQKSYYPWIFQLNPKRVIFNPGAENPELAKMLRERNIEPLEACTLVMLRSRIY